MTMPNLSIHIIPICLCSKRSIEHFVLLMPITTCVFIPFNPLNSYKLKYEEMLNNSYVSWVSFASIHISSVDTSYFVIA